MRSETYLARHAPYTERPSVCRGWGKGRHLFDDTIATECEKEPKPGKFRTRWRKASRRLVTRPQPHSRVRDWAAIRFSLGKRTAAYAEITAAGSDLVRWVVGSVGRFSDSAAGKQPRTEAKGTLKKRSAIRHEKRLRRHGSGT